MELGGLPLFGGGRHLLERRNARLAAKNAIVAEQIIPPIKTPSKSLAKFCMKAFSSEPSCATWITTGLGESELSTAEADIRKYQCPEADLYSTPSVGIRPSSGGTGKIDGGNPSPSSRRSAISCLVRWSTIPTK